MSLNRTNPPLFLSMSSGIRQVKKMSMETLKCSLYRALTLVQRVALSLRSVGGCQRNTWPDYSSRVHVRPPRRGQCYRKWWDAGRARGLSVGLFSRLGNDWKEDGISTSTSNTFREKLLCRLSCAGFYNSPFSISHVRKKMFLLLETAQRISFMHYSTTSMQINQRNVYS